MFEGEQWRHKRRLVGKNLAVETYKEICWRGSAVETYGGDTLEGAQQ